MKYFGIDGMETFHLFLEKNNLYSYIIYGGIKMVEIRMYISINVLLTFNINKVRI